MTTSRPRIAAVDFGTKRVGLAMADPLRMFAQPDGLYSPDSAVQRLKTVMESEGLETVVVGWPLMPDGSEGDSTRRTAEYARRLRNALPSVMVILRDERESTKRARQNLLEAGARRATRVSKEDAAAAAVILQDYLDEIAQAPRPQ